MVAVSVAVPRFSEPVPNWLLTSAPFVTVPTEAPTMIAPCWMLTPFGNGFDGVEVAARRCPS